MGITPQKFKPLEIKDEGLSVSKKTKTLNFVGEGVDASGIGSDAEAEIPGGGGISEDFQEGDIPFYNNETHALARSGKLNYNKIAQIVYLDSIKIIANQNGVDLWADPTIS